MPRTGDYERSTISDLVTDAVAAVQYLHSIRNVQLDGIGLLGFSQGGAIAPEVASQSKNVAFIVMIAAPAQRGDISDIEQSDRQFRWSNGVVLNELQLLGRRLRCP